MSPEVVHPSAEQLEAAAFGWLGEADAEPVRVHARGCRTCAARLASEEQLRRQLTALRSHEPRINAVDAVLSCLDQETRNRAGAPGLPPLPVGDQAPGRRPPLRVRTRARAAPAAPASPSGLR